MSDTETPAPAKRRSPVEQHRDRLLARIDALMTARDAAAETAAELARKRVRDRFAARLAPLEAMLASLGKESL